ncbi:hypothetical protein XFF7767_850014 [Xanthomonas citri pv. fuscans]|nr:hypothetical protein XFF7767_850014 [Xanthomonas citri pv. fuscans]
MSSSLPFVSRSCSSDSQVAQQSCLSFGAASSFLYLVAAVTMGLAEQDTVEPQVSKGRWCGGASEACGPTTHILPSV